MTRYMVYQMFKMAKLPIQKHNHAIHKFLLNVKKYWINDGIPNCLLSGKNFEG